MRQPSVNKGMSPLADIPRILRRLLRALGDTGTIASNRIILQPLQGLWIVYLHLLFSYCVRFIVDAPKDSGSELRTDDEPQMSRYALHETLDVARADIYYHYHRFLTAFREEFSAFREGEEKRVARLASLRACNGNFLD